MRRQLRIVFVTLIISVLVFERCAYNDINANFSCDTSTLSIDLDSKKDVSNCRAIDGMIAVTAKGGLEPYAYNINGGEYQPKPAFNNLGPGTYELRVKDGNSCWRAVSVTISAEGSTLAAKVEAQPNNQCAIDKGNGIALVTATGGNPPYMYEIDSKGFDEDAMFINLKDGQHSVVVRDHEGCQTTLNVTIAHASTGLSYANDIKTIITTNCALPGCHGTGLGSRDWTIFANVKANAASIKLRTQNRTMPPDASISDADIARIGCWVDDGALDN